jgi:hypothetical protein
MPQRPDSRSPQERLRRSRSNARMWASLSDQQRAYRLEQLRLAREKLRTIREKARTERKKKGIVTVALLPGDAGTIATPDSAPGPLAPKPRIPSALALHLAATLRRLWYQEPGHERPHAADSARTSPSAGRRIDAFPAGTTSTLNLPPGRGPWGDRLSILARRLSVAVRELLEDRAASVGYAALLTPVDRVQALESETDRLRLLLTGILDPDTASPGDARRAVDAQLGRMLESLLAFDKADRARRRAVGEPLPRRSDLPAKSNGCLRVGRHRQGLRARAEQLRRVGEVTLHPRKGDPVVGPLRLDTEEGRAALADLGDNLQGFRAKLLHVREAYLGPEGRADLLPTFDRLATLTEKVRNRLTALASTMSEGTGAREVAEVRQGLCEDLVALADAVFLFDEDERGHEKVYREALRAERQEREPPTVVVAEVVREVLSREEQVSSGDRERRRGRERDIAFGNGGVERKLDELLSLLRGRGSALRETVEGLREETIARLDHLGTAVDAIAVRQRRNDGRADECKDRYEASLQEWRDRTIQAERAYHDTLRSAIAEHVGSLEGRLAIVIRENFLRLAASMPLSEDKPLRQEAMEYALRIRTGMAERIANLIKNLGEKG